MDLRECYKLSENRQVKKMRVLTSQNEAEKLNILNSKNGINSNSHDLFKTMPNNFKGEFYDRKTFEVIWI